MIAGTEGPGDTMVIFIVKLFHTFVFLVLGVCILFLLYCAVFNRRTRWTAIALVLVVAEGIIVAVNGWRCPLADLAERWGAENGSVAGIFLPPFLAGRVFQICTPLAAVAILVLGFRTLVDRRRGHGPDARMGGAGGSGEKEAKAENL